MRSTLQIAESGLPGFETAAQFGFLGPAGTPREVVERLNAEINKAAQTQEWKERVAALGGEPVAGPPDVFAKRIANDIAKWKKVVADAG
jgi:tripartite-type tricarboxylate transporter receptor subunit TctC